MELHENNIGNSIIASNNKEDHEDDVLLPGFRFHPTDEELVGFYLKRKVEKRAISIELIKHADIYKYDPWDLPKSSKVGEKEWYFFCKRGRKYRNSIRPNRVTGSGFWKATGIDKPIYSSGSGEGRDCIGLKKSLVYYRGSAGKGTKTDWMMHEFRLPSSHDHNNSTTKHMDSKTIAQEAEVWTLCRILKRDVSYRKCISDWQVAAKKSISNPEIDANSKSCSMDSTDQNSQSNYISFNTPMMKQKPYYAQAETIANQHFLGHFSSLGASDNQTPSVASSFSSPVCPDINELLWNADWEDLRSISEYTASTNNPFYM